MPPALKNLHLHFLLLVFLISSLFLALSMATRDPSPSSSRPIIGVTYTKNSLHHPHSANRIVSVLQSLKITSIRLPDSDPDTIRAFSYSDISLLLSIPNSLIPQIATNQSKSLRWLNHHVTPFYPRVRITTISVGTDVLASTPDLSSFLIPAIQNVQLALVELGIDKISVSTTFSFANVMSTPFPPSQAQFQPPISDSLIKPLLDILAATNSCFLINLYPYNMYRDNAEIPVGYAVFQEHPFSFRDDLMTGVRYRNLFDVMVDAVVTAMAVAGHEDVPIVVTETGWPSDDGDSKDFDANPIYAELYVKGLIRHLHTGLGTPLRKDGVAGAYVFELLDDDVKESSVSKRHWGILYSNTTAKYNIDFSSSDRVKKDIDLLKLLAISVLLFLLLDNF